MAMFQAYQYKRLAHPSSDTFVGLLVRLDFERIEEILNHFLEMEDMQIFKESVDFESYPDYCKAIAYPICLDAIQERVTSGYYRRTRVSIGCKHDVMLFTSVLTALILLPPDNRLFNSI